MGCAPAGVGRGTWVCFCFSDPLAGSFAFGCPGKVGSGTGVTLWGTLCGLEVAAAAAGMGSGTAVSTGAAGFVAGGTLQWTQQQSR